MTVTGPGNSPDYPSDSVADKPALAKDKYEADITGWIERYKVQTAADAAALAVGNAREDTATALSATRQDTATALSATRRDTATALSASREDADAAAENALLKGIHDVYLATTQSSLDRALTRANFVTAAAGSITTIYTGLLALLYSVDTSKGKALSVVAIAPALFVGAALVLVTIYATLIKRSTAVGPFLPTGIGGDVAEIRLVTFMRWCFAGVLARTWALHAGIASLGVGLVSLPLPFVSLRGWVQVAIVAVGLLIVAAAGIVE